MGAIFSVIEDGAGGLHLYVFGDAARSVVLYAGRDYQFRPGHLIQDIAAIRNGADVSAWEGGEADAKADWESWSEQDRRNGGWKLVADENGVFRAALGNNARDEFACPVVSIASPGFAAALARMGWKREGLADGAERFWSADESSGFAVSADEDGVSVALLDAEGTPSEHKATEADALRLLRNDNLGGWDYYTGTR